MVSKKRQEYGGLAAREKRGPLWRFTDPEAGVFRAPHADYISDIYFPLCNMHGMKSSITADFKGDIAADFSNYLTVPIVTEDLHRVTNSRNFWVYVKGKTPWSATGLSAYQSAGKWREPEDSVVEAGPGWFSTIRRNPELGLEAKAEAFVPAAPDMVEILRVTVRNTGRTTRTFTPTAALPIFGRHADHLRDHRQVTTTMNRFTLHRNGVIVSPSIHHDEHGHVPNHVSYAVLGCTGRGGAPTGTFPTVRSFIGEGGSYDNPEAVAKDLRPPRMKAAELDGREAMGAIRFRQVTLKPGKSLSFVVLFAISERKADFDRWLRKYGTDKKVDAAFRKTRAFWKDLANRVAFGTGDSDMDGWLRWVACQSVYRKVYGNSYLPDYGYGRGGRGWRDLWQDLLALLLVDPEGARADMVNNFQGVRIDGTNATIIGARPGEFIADRNNIARVWCDHASWPTMVLKFYLDQTGDWKLLFRKLTYFKDHFVHRTREIDGEWEERQGNRLRTIDGKVWRGTILEHVLVQNLCAFYHVGKNGNILLEGADWNDCYDMGRTRGESVCFTHFYAWNLACLADLLNWAASEGVHAVEVLAELKPLLDRLPRGKRVDYASPGARRKCLRHYMETVRHSVSGRTIKLKPAALAADLRAKSDALYAHVREKEWLRVPGGREFYNGHYDDSGRRVHGLSGTPDGVRMDLTSQVISILCESATPEQIKEIVKSAWHYLRHPVTGALRVSTPFKSVKLDFGRVTGFAYGFREHGSQWNQQNIMFMLGLYKHGFVDEGYRVWTRFTRALLDSATTRVYPNVPSSMLPEGRGSYCYLTASGTWLLLAMLTEVFGVRGKRGDLVIAPRLKKEQFDERGRATARFSLQGRRLEVTFVNRGCLDYGAYAITGVLINGRQLLVEAGPDLAVAMIGKAQLRKLPRGRISRITVVLGLR